MCRAAASSKPLRSRAVADRQQTEIRFFSACPQRIFLGNLLKLYPDVGIDFSASICAWRMVLEDADEGEEAEGFRGNSPRSRSESSSRKRDFGQLSTCLDVRFPRIGNIYNR